MKPSYDFWLLLGMGAFLFLFYAGLALLFVVVT